VLAIAATLIAVLRGTRRHAPLRHYLLALAAMAGMTLVMVFVQHKGWRYHRIPLDIAGLLCLAVLASRANRLSTLGLPRFSARNLFVVGLLGVLLTVWLTARTDALASVPPFAALRRVVENRSRPGDRVLIVATSVYPAYPILLQTGRRAGSRYAWSFPIALYYADAQPDPTGRLIYRRRQEAPAEERQFLHELEEDVHRLRPQLIIVQHDDGWSGLPADFNTFDYLVYSGWTKDGLARYRELPGPEGWKVFERTCRP
jgi:hypothetical protein